MAAVSSCNIRQPLARATTLASPSGPGASISALTSSICLPGRSNWARTHRSPSEGTPPIRSMATRLRRVSARCSQRSSARTSSAETGAACWIAADQVPRVMSVARNFSPIASFSSISS